MKMIKVLKWAGITGVLWRGEIARPAVEGKIKNVEEAKLSTAVKRRSDFDSP
jgi:hypothetical protein